MAGEVDIDALVAASSETRQAQYCWAAPERTDPIPDRCREYLEALEEVGAQNVSPTQISRLIREHWGLNLSREQIRRHLAFECKCR